MGRDDVLPLLCLGFLALPLQGCRSTPPDRPPATRDAATPESNVVPARDDSPFQTDRLLYVARRTEYSVPRAVAVVTYGNSRATPVYLDVGARKSGPDSIVATQPTYSVVEAATGARAEGMTVEWACVDSGGRRRVVHPGGTLVASILLLPHRPPWCELPPDDPRGLLRVVYRAYDRQASGPDERGLLPAEERRSNVFRVVCEPAAP